MGISKGSVWGNIKQSVGSAVGYRLKGQNVVRQKPLGYIDANTLVQQKNRLRLANLVILYRVFKSYVVRRFQGMPETYSDYNSFVSLNTSTVDVNDSLDVEINASSLQISKGNAVLPHGITFNMSGSDLVISWDPLGDGITSFTNDYVNIYMVDMATQKVIYANEKKLLRSNGTCSIDSSLLPTADSIYINVIDVNGNSSATFFQNLPL